MRSILVLVSVFFLCAGVSAACGADRLAGTVEAAFHQVMDDYDIPGGAFILVEDGKVVRLGARGVRKRGAVGRVDTDTIFPLASVSKTFAGTLTALLVREQKVRLDDRIKAFVPKLALRTPGHTDRLTVEHILSHSTGLVPNAYDNLLDAGESLDLILPKFKRVRPICAPGTCYGYQNIFFSLIQPVVEQTTRTSYAELLKSKLITPLGLTRTSVGYASLRADTNHATPHFFRKAAGWTALSIKPNYYEVLPAAGVNASIKDLGAWLIAHMGQRPDVLDPALLSLVRQKRTHTTREKYRRFWKHHVSDAHYGLGWRLYEFQGEDLVYHGGGIEGFRSSVAYAPEHGIGLAVVMNAESRAIDDLNTQVWDHAFKSIQAARSNGDEKGR